MLFKTNETEFYELTQSTWSQVIQEAKRFKNQRYAQRVMVKRLGKQINSYYASKNPVEVYLDNVPPPTKEDKESLRAYYV